MWIAHKCHVTREMSTHAERGSSHVEAASTQPREQELETRLVAQRCLEQEATCQKPEVSSNPDRHTHLILTQRPDRGLGTTPRSEAMDGKSMLPIVEVPAAKSSAVRAGSWQVV